MNNTFRTDCRKARNVVNISFTLLVFCYRAQHPADIAVGPHVQILSHLKMLNCVLYSDATSIKCHRIIYTLGTN